MNTFARQRDPDSAGEGEFPYSDWITPYRTPDAVLLIVYPVLWGTGKRFFADGMPTQSFEFAGTTATPSGVMLTTYKVAGPVKKLTGPPAP